MEAKRPEPVRADDKEAALERFPEHCERLALELGKVIVGQREVVRHVLTAFFVGGHCLLQRQQTVCTHFQYIYHSFLTSLQLGLDN